MSVENAKKFILRMSQDTAFRDSITNAKDDAARREIAQREGYSCTRAEVEALLKGGHPDGEISDAELEAVSGGKNGAGVSAIVSMAVSVAALG